ncbi:MAG TPA: hypothetical protein PKY77_25235 [Phycisphaerae bacterium]|nr:hypothetical protein [Phycisphaerae bacterium]HRY71492.1 hypothetical protein [Phycisphaerae bacterium]HSA29927.1 hypothetical protein [Phycisphaerae bacterium]
MKAKKPKDITAIFREGTLIDRALAAGVREAIRRHKQAGVPMAIWRNGKTVWVDAATLEPKPRNRRSKPRP